MVRDARIKVMDSRARPKSSQITQAWVCSVSMSMIKISCTLPGLNGSRKTEIVVENGASPSRTILLSASQLKRAN